MQKNKLPTITTPLNIPGYNICLFCRDYDYPNYCNDAPDNCNILVCKSYNPLQIGNIKIAPIDFSNYNDATLDVVRMKTSPIEETNHYSLCLLCENYRKGYSCCSDPKLMEKVSACQNYVRLGSKNADTKVLLNMLKMLVL